MSSIFTNITVMLAQTSFLRSLMSDAAGVAPLADDWPSLSWKSRLGAIKPTAMTIKYAGITVILRAFHQPCRQRWRQTGNQYRDIKSRRQRCVPNMRRKHRWQCRGHHPVKQFRESPPAGQQNRQNQANNVTTLIRIAPDR